MLEQLKDRHIILASHSPRRRFLLKQLGIDFTETSADVDESFPGGMTPEETAIYLAEKKARCFVHLLDEPANIIITADTLVIVNGRILGKPDGRAGAFEMLKTLSGNMHQVVTGICLWSTNKKCAFTSLTKVSFKVLTDEEINFYLDHYQPFDKAGAYGIQEWIGYIGITHIEGSYFNVMGLPIQRLYEELRQF